MTTHRHEFAVTRLILSALTAALLAPVTTAAEPKKPSGVFILADDLGWADLTPYGSTFHDTPNLRRLADRSVRFTDYYAASPRCSPTRSSVLTGLYSSHSFRSRIFALPNLRDVGFAGCGNRIDFSPSNPWTTIEVRPAG